MKRLAIVFVVICIIFAVYLSISSPKEPSDIPPGVQETPETASESGGIGPDEDINDAVMAFYEEYKECLGNKRIPKDCMSGTGYTSSEFEKNIQAGGMTAIDPIFCAQNIPNTIRIESVVQSISHRATVRIVESFVTEDKTVSVTTVKDKDFWKVANVNCVPQ